ncbi:MAG: hypothetical protein AAFV01_12115 [Bacteroidota bacterium]
MADQHGTSVRRGCQAVGIARSSYRYERRPTNDDDVIEALNQLVEEKPAIGFWQAYHRLRAAGYRWNHKRVAPSRGASTGSIHGSVSTSGVVRRSGCLRA